MDGDGGRLRQATPERHTSLFSRLCESAKKLDQCERNQIDQLQSRIAKQNVDSERLESDLSKSQAIRLSYHTKLLQIHQTFAENTEQLIKNLPTVQPSVSDLAAKNKFLMAQLRSLLSSPEALQAQVEQLEQELAHAQRRNIELSANESPDDEQRNEESLKTLKILKSQCRGVEEYVRNGAKLEKDEIQLQIRRLQRKSAALMKDVKAAKDGQKRNEGSQRRIAGVQQLVELCTELEKDIDTKTERTEQLKAECDRDIRKLDDLIKTSEAMENEIRNCHALVLCAGDQKVQSKDAKRSPHADIPQTNTVLVAVQ